MNVDVGRSEPFVSEPQRDNGGIHPGVQRRMAAVWRSVCGVTFFSRREGQARVAAVKCVAKRCASASRLRAWPVRVGKAGASGVPARSVSHVRGLRPPAS